MFPEQRNSIMIKRKIEKKDKSVYKNIQIVFKTRSKITYPIIYNMQKV